MLVLIVWHHYRHDSYRDEPFWHSSKPFYWPETRKSHLWRSLKPQNGELFQLSCRLDCTKLALPWFWILILAGSSSKLTWNSCFHLCLPAAAHLRLVPEQDFSFWLQKKILHSISAGNASAMSSDNNFSMWRSQVPQLLHCSRCSGAAAASWGDLLDQRQTIRWVWTIYTQKHGNKEPRFEKYLDFPFRLINFKLIRRNLDDQIMIQVTSCLICHTRQ